jgi:hypothetical protein
VARGACHHLPQGVHVTSELQHLVSVSEQIVTGQSGSPVVKLIQDAVVVAYCPGPRRAPRPRPRLTQIDPRTLCPLAMPRSTFSQIAADIDVDLHARLAQIRGAWDRFRSTAAGAAHPTVRAMAAADVDYGTTGFCLFSLCLPAACDFRGREPATNHLVTIYRRSRGLPGTAVRVDVRDGLFLGGFLTADALTGSRGLLNHVYQSHGPQAGLKFLSRIQRLTTCVSLYGCCPSVGLDDCLLGAAQQRAARAIVADRVERHRCAAAAGVALGGEAAASLCVRRAPYRLDGDDLPEAEINRLVSLRRESEAFVVRQALRERCRTAGDRVSPAGAGRLNQIALFCMLGTKGSVSNLMQCTHALGRPGRAGARNPPARPARSRSSRTRGCRPRTTTACSRTTRSGRRRRAATRRAPRAAGCSGGTRSWRGCRPWRSSSTRSRGARRSWRGRRRPLNPAIRCVSASRRWRAA